MEPLTKYYLSQGYSNLKAHVVIPKISGVLSILGNCYIIVDILRDSKKRTQSIYHRIMLGLSILDLIGTVSMHLMSSWPMPKGYYIMAIGSVGTCDAAAFFTQIGLIGASLYHCSLTTFLLIQLKYNWQTRKIKAFEKWFHIVPWSVGIVSAIAGLASNAFGPFLAVCWVTPSYPAGCKGDECIRGGNITHYFFWIFAFLVLAFAAIYVSVTMFMVYRTVLDIEQKSDNFSILRFTQKNIKNRKRSRKIMINGVLYSASLLLVSVAALLCLMHNLITEELSDTFDTYLIIAYPLKGFFNVLIYSMPFFHRQWKRCRNKFCPKKKTTRISLMLKSKTGSELHAKSDNVFMENSANLTATSNGTSYSRTRASTLVSFRRSITGSGNLFFPAALPPTKNERCAKVVGFLEDKPDNMENKALSRKCQSDILVDIGDSFSTRTRREEIKRGSWRGDRDNLRNAGNLDLDMHRLHSSTLNSLNGEEMNVIFERSQESEDAYHRSSETELTFETFGGDIYKNDDDDENISYGSNDLPILTEGLEEFNA